MWIGPCRTKYPARSELSAGHQQKSAGHVRHISQSLLYVAGVHKIKKEMHDLFYHQSCSVLRLELNCSLVEYYTELDAVRMWGYVPRDTSPPPLEGDSDDDDDPPPQVL